MKCIIDTPHMQRLRGLKQLGISEMTYMSTTHTRFEHSLGVAHLAQAVLLKIAEKQPKLNITEKDIVCVKLAGLLHDIGKKKSKFSCRVGYISFVLVLIF